MKKTFVAIACLVLASSTMLFAMGDNRNKTSTDEDTGMGVRSSDRSGQMDASRSSTTGGVMRSGATGSGADWDTGRRSGSGATGSGSTDSEAVPAGSDTGSGSSY